MVSEFPFMVLDPVTFRPTVRQNTTAEVYNGEKDSQLMLARRESRVKMYPFKHVSSVTASSREVLLPKVPTTFKCPIKL
jgi:hypothetical protein